MRSVRILGKSVSALTLVGILLASTAAGVLAWQVYRDGLADVTVTVNRAGADVDPISISLGGVGSGYEISGSGEATITTTNAKELVVTVAVEGLDDAEMAALESLTVSIGEVSGTDDIRVLVPWGEIHCIPVPGEPETVVRTVLEGTHTIEVSVDGTAAYPEEMVAIQFLVTATIETPT